MIKRFFQNKKRLFSFVGFAGITSIELIFSFLYTRFNFQLLWDSFHKIASFLAIVCFFIFMCTLRNIFGKIVCIAILCFVAFHYFVIVLIVNLQTRNYYFSSPNNINTLIAQERRGFDEDSCYFYVKKHFIFKERIDNYYLGIKDYKPFSENTYQINWVNDGEIHFSFYRDGETYLTIGDRDFSYHYSNGIVTEYSVKDGCETKEYKADLKDLVLKIKIAE